MVNGSLFRLTYVMVLLGAALSGCITTGALREGSPATVDLTQGNFQLVATNVSGSASAMYVLGFSGEPFTISGPRISGSSTLYHDAVQALWAAFEKQHGSPTGRRLALINIRHDFAASNLLLLATRPRVTVTADVVEFLAPEPAPALAASPAPAAAPAAKPAAQQRPAAQPKPAARPAAGAKPAAPAPKQPAQPAAKPATPPNTNAPAAGAQAAPPPVQQVTISTPVVNIVTEHGPAPEAEPRTAPKPARPARKPAPEGGIPLNEGGYTWIVSSAADLERATALAAEYRTRGFRSDVLTGTAEGDPPRRVYRVALGYFHSLDEAYDARATLPADAAEGAWIMRIR